FAHPEVLGGLLDGHQSVLSHALNRAPIAAERPPWANCALPEPPVGWWCNISVRRLGRKYILPLGGARGESQAARAASRAAWRGKGTDHQAHPAPGRLGP